MMASPVRARVRGGARPQCLPRLLVGFALVAVLVGVGIRFTDVGLDRAAAHHQPEAAAAATIGDSSQEMLAVKTAPAPSGARGDAVDTVRLVAVLAGVVAVGLLPPLAGVSIHRPPDRVHGRRFVWSRVGRAPPIVMA